MSASQHAAADVAPEPSAVSRPVSKSAATAAVRSAAAAAALALVLATGSCKDRGPTGPGETVERTLTVVVSGQGAGTITSQPTGIDCSATGGTCSMKAPNGTQVTLTANAAGRSNFGGWTDACAGDGACMIMLNADRTVGAMFGNAHLVTAEIGPAGGTLTSSDGKVVLTVPAGALGGTVPITIESIDIAEAGPEFDALVDNPDLDVAAYRMGPAGTSFQLPVVVTAVLGDPVTEVDGVIQVPIAALVTARGGQAELLESLVLEPDAAGVRIQGEVHHFSPIVAFTESRRDDAVLKARMTAEGVPFRWVVQDGEFAVALNVTFSGALPLLGNFELRYTNFSTAPLVARSPEGTLDEVAANPGERTFTATVAYTCLLAGRARFDIVLWMEDIEYHEWIRFFLPIQLPESGRLPRWTLTNFNPLRRWVDCVDPLNPELALVPGASYQLAGRAEGINVPRTTQTGAENTATAVDQDGNRTDLRAVPGGDAYSGRVAFGTAAGSGTSGPGLEVIQTVENFCPGATGIFFHRPANNSGPAPMFTALSPGLQRGCRSVLGSSTTTTINFQRPITSGVMAGSHLVFSNFQGSAHIRNIDEDLLGRHDRELVPGQRSCPWSSASRSNTVLIVAREGAAGTSNEDCNQTRGLYKLEIPAFNTSVVTGSLLVGTMPREVVISPDGGTAYLADYAEKLIHVIDVGSMTVTGTIPAGGGPTGLALTADGALLLAAYWDTNEVAVLDVASGQELMKTGSGGEQPVSVRLSSDEQVVWVLNYGKDDVADAVVRVFRLVRP